MAYEKQTVKLDGEKITFKQGALHKQLGIPMDKDVGRPLMKKISESEVGDMIMIPQTKKKVKVNALMKKRAVFGLTLSKGSSKKK